MDIAEIKRKARGDASKRRAGAHEYLKDTAGLALAARGLPDGVSRTPGIVSGFIPYQSEITTIPLLNALRRGGWRTAMPVVIAQGLPLLFRAWAPGEALVPGVWGIPMPPETAPEVLPDVLLVPLLAFDREGYRLGYGGGFYDRTLADARKSRHVTAVGVAFDEQRLDAVPHVDYDEPLDWLLTPSGPQKAITTGMP